MELEQFLHGLGITREHKYWDDCMQEARIALHALGKSNPTPAYKRQAVKWAIYNFLNAQLAENHMELLPRHERPEKINMEDRIVRRLAREYEYRELTEDLTPLERVIYVLSVSSPLTQNQIADTLEVSARTVRRSLVEAQKKLARIDQRQRTQIRARKARKAKRTARPSPVTVPRGKTAPPSARSGTSSRGGGRSARVVQKRMPRPPRRATFGPGKVSILPDPPEKPSCGSVV